MENSLSIGGKILLGTGKFGGVIEDGRCFEMMDLFYELGGRAIDTGHCYGMFYPGGGRQPLAERVIGKYLKQRIRSDYIVCTKGGYMDLDTGDSRISEKCLRADLEASLRELQTDYIDIYYLHRDDVNRPVSEIVPIMNSFIKEGKIREAGASNWSHERVREANDFALANGYKPIKYVQNLYNLGVYSSWPQNDRTMRITTEKDRQAFRSWREVQFVAYSAQGYGVFSKADPSDMSGYRNIMDETYPFFDAATVRERAKRVRSLADRYGVLPSVIALSYVLSDPMAPAAVIGCTKISQMKEAMGAMALHLSEEELAYLEEPAPKTDIREEQ